jgi:DNA helicase IV
MTDEIPSRNRVAEEMVAVKTELEQEQAYVSMLYDRLDALRARTAERVAQALRPAEEGGTYQGRLERDALVTRYRDRLAQLWSAESGLCFGRLDLADGTRRYVGRLGLADDHREPLLVDWRAPAARPFYRATPTDRSGVVRRRHLRTRGRVVVDFEDDVLDLDALSDDQRSGLSGEAALLASLDASRTGRMGEIVATIQAEQDRIIRSDLRGILVVEGGPGTGKTAVALHRAAYLLYTHRERLARRGVLVVGPNPTFLRYIEQVLPSLGETGVLLATTAELFPGVTATAIEPPEAAGLKGDARMVQVLAAAVRDRQRVPDEDLEIPFDGQVLRLDRATCWRARMRARAASTPHNQARAVFRRELLAALSRQVVAHLVADLPEVELPDDDLINDDVPSERMLDAVEEIRSELGAAPRVRAAIDGLWPRLTPQELLTGLLTSPERLAAAAPELSEAERGRLLREPPERRVTGGAGWWTPADVPLLDEAAVLLGETDGGAAREALLAEQRRREEAYARGVLSMVGIDEHRYGGAALLAARQRDIGPDNGIAERARQDRTWTFGHVIVDEAQEVSAMAWRMLMRRCPARSMTVAGDTAQRAAPGGVRSWAEVLEPHAPGSWRVEELTVNYRTPVEIIDVAAEVLATLSPELRPPRSVRQTGTVPWALRLDEAELAARLAEVVAGEASAIGDGKLAVLVPTARFEELRRRLAGVPGVAAERGPAALDAKIAVLTVAEAKGLEFDSVVIVDPSGIIAESPRGAANLYVALTRATKRLGVVHGGDLPRMLRRLSEMGAGDAHARDARNRSRGELASPRRP